MKAQTAEEAKSLSKTESCDRKPVIHLQMPACRNLIYFAGNRNINQFQGVIRGHGVAKIRHTYTLVWSGVVVQSAEGMLRQITYKYMHASTVHCPVQSGVCVIIYGSALISPKDNSDINDNLKQVTAETRHVPIFSYLEETRILPSRHTFGHPSVRVMFICSQEQRNCFMLLQR